MKKRRVIEEDETSTPCIAARARHRLRTPLPEATQSERSPVAQTITLDQQLATIRTRYDNLPKRETEGRVLGKMNSYLIAVQEEEGACHISTDIRKERLNKFIESYNQKVHECYNAIKKTDKA